MLSIKISEINIQCNVTGHLYNLSSEPLRVAICATIYKMEIVVSFACKLDASVSCRLD